MQGKELFSGGHGGRGTPGPMPNPEVKPASADGTVWGTHGRVGRCQKTDLKAEGADLRQLPPLLLYLSLLLRHQPFKL